MHSSWGLCWFLRSFPGGQSLASGARQSRFESSLWLSALTSDKLRVWHFGFLICKVRAWDHWPPWCVRSKWVYKMVSFPGGSIVKNLPANAGEGGLIPGFGRSPGEGHGNPPQYSCLGNPMDRGAWWATVLGFTKSQTQLSHWRCSASHLARDESSGHINSPSPVAIASHFSVLSALIDQSSEGTQPPTPPPATLIFPALV